MLLSSSGVIYFADSGHLRIRNIDAATGIITAFVCSAHPSHLGDSGPATSANLVWGNSNGIHYIADNGNYRIRQVDTSGIITTFTGNGNSVYNGDNIPATAALINLNLVT